MYDPKDIQFVGRHDYDRESAERFASWNGKSFSVNIFQWVMKVTGKEMRPSKGKVRITGSPKVKAEVFSAADTIVQQLDAGTWDGRKTVTIKG